MGGLAKANFWKFTRSLINTYTRKDAFECRIPRQRALTHFEFRRYDTTAVACDVFSQATIPPYDYLRNWETELEKRHKLAVGYFYVETNRERYDLEGIKYALSLHSARKVKENVARELDWLSTPYLRPHSVKKEPSLSCMSNFKSMLYLSPYSEPIENLRMDSREVAFICCRREVSCDHILWITKKLNLMQESTFVFYLNYSMICLGSYQESFLSIKPNLSQLYSS